LVVGCDNMTVYYTVHLMMAPMTVILGANLDNAPVGMNGRIIANLTLFGPDSMGTVTLMPTDLSELRAGRIYLNIRTSAYVPGEIRGWFVQEP
jgi:hypothetical protein